MSTKTNTLSPNPFNDQNNKPDIESSVKLLRINMNKHLSFNQHISDICKYASNNLNALGRLKTLLGFKTYQILINTFILSKFSGCPFVCLVLLFTSLNELENLQKRALGLLYNGYISSYDQFPEKSGKTSLSRTLCLLKNLNPSFMDICHLRLINLSLRYKYKLILEILETNQVKLGQRAYECLFQKYGTLCCTT